MDSVNNNEKIDASKSDTSEPSNENHVHKLHFRAGEMPEWKYALLLGFQVSF